MLTEKQLIDLCKKHQLNQDAIERVQNIRNSNPSRNVASGTHNVATHFASRKMGRVIKAEARCKELAILFHWEHDPSVYGFYDHPPSNQEDNHSTKWQGGYPWIQARGGVRQTDLSGGMPLVLSGYF